MAKATFFDAMQSLGGAGANVASGMDKELREKAHSDLLYMQADYRQAETDFLNELAQSNEYSPDFYKKKLSDFENEWRTKFQQQSRNGYTSREADKMFIQNQPQLYAKVQAQYRQRENAHYLQQDMETIDKNNSTLPGTERLDANNEVIENSFRAGRINEAQKAQLQQENYAGVLYDTEKANASRIMKNAVANGRSLDEALKMFDENYSANDIFKDYQGPGLENFTDKERKSIIDKVKTAAKEEYNTELKAKQQQTDDTLTAIFEKVKSTADPEMQELYKKQGRDAMKAIEKNTPLYIGQDQRVTWATRFAPDTMKQASGGGGKKKSTSTSEKNLIEDLLNNVRLGKNSELEGVTTGHQAIDYIRTIGVDTIADEFGIDKNSDEYDALKKRLYFDTIDGLEKLYTSKAETNQLAPVVAQVKALVNDWAKSEKFNANELETSIMAEFVDMFADIDMTDKKSIDNAANTMKKKIIGLQTSNIESIKQGKAESSRFIEKHMDKNGNIKDPDKALASGIYQLNQTKVIYSDLKNTDVISANADDAVKKVIDPSARSAIRVLDKLNNVNLDKIEARWESDGKHDYTGNREYIDTENGNTYKFVPTGEKTFDVYMNGKKVWNQDDLKKARKDQNNKAAEQRENEKQEKRRKVKEAADAETYQRMRKFVLDQFDTYGGKISRPNGTTYPAEAWAALPNDQKLNEIERLGVFDEVYNQVYNMKYTDDTRRQYDPNYR